MRYSALALVCLAGYAAAFPNLDVLAAYLPSEGNRIASPVKRQSSSPPQGAGAAPSSPPPFDAAAQLVSVSGEHAWQAPSASDERGECPGLNAMANHGYLPRSGIATIPQFYEACMTVFGMGKDLAIFLATYGALVDGDGISWSIGGKPHTGIGGSHNNYETDSSPLKADLYQYGNLEKLVIPQYQELFNMQPDASTANYNLEVLRDFRGSRFNESIAKNPKFFYGPFSGMLVSQAAFTFIYRFMANKSAEYPEGILNQDVLKSFMSISGTNAKPVWKPGQERIPDNWYTRNSADYYTIQYFSNDIGYFSDKYPQINDIGCNQGRVNSFEAINTSNLTSGAYTSEQAAANPLCFGLEYALAELPSLTGLNTSALEPLTSLLNEVTSTLDCTPIMNLNTNVFDICPGGLSLFGGPTAKRAKGAIRSRDVESREEDDIWCC